MATFPALKTGAVAQYPFSHSVRYSTHAVRFMDGSLQKFRLIGNGLRRWVVKLDLLDETELGAVIAFVEQQGAAPFPFTDPFSGQTVTTCIISEEQFKAGMKQEMSGQATLTIEETA